MCYYSSGITPAYWSASIFFCQVLRHVHALYIRYSNGIELLGKRMTYLCKHLFDIHLFSFLGF